MEQNFNPRLVLIGPSGTGPSGLDRTYEVALRAPCQCSFCMIKGLTGVSWFHRLYLFFFLANYIVPFITLLNTLYSSSSTIT